MRKIGAVSAASLCLLVAGPTAVADPVEGLTSFSAGTLARADEVNGNFTEVAESVNDNDARIAELEARIESLETQLGNMIALSDHMSLEIVNGQPTVRVTAANLQVVNGTNDTETATGTGNLLIGYDEERVEGDPQCSVGFNADLSETVASEQECLDAGGVWAISHKGGSHYLVVGAENNYTRWGGVVIGLKNTSNYDFASVSGGLENTASGNAASVSGGLENTASGNAASVSGGWSNTASGGTTSVSGGARNTASGEGGSVSGGQFNNAIGTASSVSGGFSNDASAAHSSVSGGANNAASGNNSAVSGGLNRSAIGGSDWVAGTLFEDD